MNDELLHHNAEPERSVEQRELLDAIHADDEALGQTVTTIIDYIPEAVGRYSHDDVRHIITGQTYLAAARMGIAAFNMAALRTLHRNNRAVEQAALLHGITPVAQNEVAPELDALQEEFLVQPHNLRVAQALLDLERQRLSPAQRAVLEQVGQAMLATDQGRVRGDALSQGFLLAEELGISQYMVAFEGKLGTGRYWDTSAYRTWFQSILKSNFPTLYQQLQWEDIGVPPGHYGIWSMGMSVDAAQVDFDVRMNPTPPTPDVPVRIMLKSLQPDHDVLLRYFNGIKEQDPSYVVQQVVQRRSAPLLPGE